MSVVVAKVYSDRIEVAADSICVRGYSKVNGDQEKHVKMVKYNEMILGGCGSCEETNLFFHYMKSHIIEKMDYEHVMDFVLEFIRWKHDYTGDEEFSNRYILAYKRKCFVIKGLYVYEVDESTAIGVGEDYARGALYMGATPKQAVKAACALCVYVCEPVIVETIKK